MTNDRPRVTELRTEYAREPLGIDEVHPRFSWQIVSDRRCEIQSAYQILVCDEERDILLDRGTVWDSGRVDSNQSIHIEYAGRALVSTKRYYWKVRIWDSRGDSSEYSEISSFEMGLLDASEFVGSWISISKKRPDALRDGIPYRPVPYFRKEFVIGKPVKRARVYSTALGIYEMYLNGKRVGDDVLSPGWTDYNRQVQYQTYGATHLLAQGTNAIGVVLADGWYSGHVAHVGPNVYGCTPAFFLQMHIEYADGSTEKVVSDDSWKWTYGPILYADLLKGEVYDARLELPGWCRPGYDDSSWDVAAVVHDASDRRLRAQVAPPIRRIETLKPISIVRRDNTRYIVDFGQNMVGWVRIKARGQEGSTLILDHAEVLDSEGEVYTENLRSIRQVDRYVFRGDDDECFEPRFTQHGFRYVEVSCSDPFSIVDITGCVVHASLERTGEFECSNALVNGIYRNILWTQKGNFLTVPTDCPQRDERMGWLGDAQIFAGTASLNMDVALFYTKWMADIAAAQSADGAFCSVAPAIKGTPYGVPAWGDAGVIIPWTLYRVYGDTRVIERHYGAMQRWIDHLQARSEGYLGTDYGFGDWLSLEEDDDTPKDLISTAYFAYSTRLMSEMARAIGRVEDAARYDQLFTAIRETFAREFVSDDGRIKGDTQTGYVIALHMDLVPEEQRNRAVFRLVSKLSERDWHLSTGILGTAYALSVLSSAGLDEIAYRLLTNETFPSWGYMLRCGATTIWERWDGWTEERGFQNPAMNSFNHYALGSVGKWIYECVGGIAADEEVPGFRKIVIYPRLDPSIRQATTRLKTMYGEVSCKWSHSQGRFDMEVLVPANTSATVVLPSSDVFSITESGRRLSEAEDIDFSRCWNGRVALAIGSGRYVFSVVSAQ